ncbi:MAG: hypothetical protein DMD78_04255 [Candidatus Rokuibacteriota bacterium]|nr:MAG: hypothetical protein DMD78_04255 [Candidatus Rokubacteria bacterium]
MRKNTLTLAMAMLCALGAAGPSVDAAAGTGYFTIEGDINASLDIQVKDCVVSAPGNTLMNGLSLKIEHSEMIPVGTLHVPPFGGDKTYVRNAPGDATVSFSFLMHKVARDRQLFEANVGEGRPGRVVVTVNDNGRSGEMTFVGVGLTQAGANKGTVSGSLKWTCAP